MVVFFFSVEILVEELKRRKEINGQVKMIKINCRSSRVI